MKTIKDTWFPIPGYGERYLMNSTGDILSYTKKHGYRPIRSRTHKSGYRVINLSLNVKGSCLKIHRLVATMFLPNPLKKCCVNHKNGNKLDNRVENLEWVTVAENNRHAILTGLFVLPLSSTPVINQCTGKVYKSIRDAAADAGISYEVFKKYLQGRRRNPTCFRYKNRH